MQHLLYFDLLFLFKMLFGWGHLAKNVLIEFNLKRLAFEHIALPPFVFLFYCIFFVDGHKRPTVAVVYHIQKLVFLPIVIFLQVRWRVQGFINQLALFVIKKPFKSLCTLIRSNSWYTL
jgi:hypothetical protein